MYKILFIISFLFVFSVFSCKSQAQYTKIDKTNELKNKKFDKNFLSEFIDTSIIKRYDKAIYRFLQNDSININRQTDIVFVGSSSIRKWDSLYVDMDTLKVLNRGFGGSTVPEAIYYSEVLFIKHKPNKVVFYSGDNDIAMLYSTNKQVMKSYKIFYDLFTKKLPNSELYILSIKPSPGRMHFWPQMNKMNKLLYDFCKNTKNCTYIDVSSKMFDKENKLKTDIFLNDKIHLNLDGYKIWKNIIYPILLK